MPFACGSRAGGRRSRKRSEESPDSQGRVLGNAQAERSDTGATESTPPMAGVRKIVGSGKGEMVGQEPTAVVATRLAGKRHPEQGRIGGCEERDTGAAPRRSGRSGH